MKNRYVLNILERLILREGEIEGKREDKRREKISRIGDGVFLS